MSSHGERLGVVLLALLVSTAGCTGLPGGGSSAGDGTDGAESNAADGEKPTAADDGSTGGKTQTTQFTGQLGVSLGGYQFAEGERYTYRVNATFNTRTVVWAVTDVSGNEVTVELTSEPSGNTQRTTIQGPQSQIFRQVVGNTVAGSFASLRANNLLAETGSLSVGNAWTIRSQNVATAGPVRWETADVEVTGTQTHAGIECTVLEVTPDAQGTDPFLACVNPDVPFALNVTSTGASQGSIVLQSADR